MLNPSLTNYSHQLRPALKKQAGDSFWVASTRNHLAVRFGVNTNDSFVTQQKPVTSGKKSGRTLGNKILIGLSAATTIAGGVVAALSLFNPFILPVVGLAIGGAGLLTFILSLALGKPKTDKSKLPNLEQRLHQNLLSSLIKRIRKK